MKWEQHRKALHDIAAIVTIAYASAKLIEFLISITF